MANEFPDRVGNVDVISDAENIKTLLKMPFSDSHVSLMVHRVQKSLLIDEFDVSRSLLRAEEKQWEWLREFIYKHLSQHEESGSVLPWKSTSRHMLQSSDMFNKFLHYSIVDSQDDSSFSPKENNISPSTGLPSPQNEPDTTDGLALEAKKDTSFDSWSLEVSAEAQQHELDVVEEKNSGSQAFSPEGQSTYPRNLLWTFQDIQMLVGSDMPIFGDASHPAVSLRLRDVTKPINILTGLDYWLDNLMCEVPEVVMCYHLDGIVQKYELIKTEDIPHLQSSQFSPKVIRDIAQNILSFLKSKATKSGHTYWLFKGKHDGVVKLYDLTSLCKEYINEESYNPYSIPVAMLLYRVAKNLKDSEPKSGPTVYKLLSNCLKLTDSKKHSKITIPARFLMIDLLVPLRIDLSESKSKQKSTTNEESDDAFDVPSDEEEDESSSDETLSCIEVKKLKEPCTKDWKTVKRKKVKKKPNKDSATCILKKDWRTRSEECLKLLKINIDLLVELRKDEEKEIEKNEKEKKEEVLSFPKPTEPIPMGYTPLSEEDKSTKSDSSKGSELVSTHKQEAGWALSQIILNLQKSAHVYSVLAEIQSNEGKYESSLRTIRLSSRCFHAAKRLSAACEVPRNTCDFRIISCLLGLAGDNHFLSTKSDPTSLTPTEPTLYEQEFLEILEKLGVDNDGQEYSWCFLSPNVIDLGKERRLTISLKCYELAISIKQDECEKTSGEEKIFQDDQLESKLKRKLGNVYNELGAYYMNEATKCINESKQSSENMTQKLTSLTSKSLSFLEKGINMFDSVGDTVNSVLLYSNIGKLMRICGHVFIPLSPDNKRPEFTVKEKNLYHKAIHYYENALKLLKTSKTSSPEIVTLAGQLNWEISSTYFTLATLLQDFAPISYCAYQQIEKDIDHYFKKCLEHLDEAEKGCPEGLACLYGIRRGTIYHRLASLYHHSYRNLGENDGKRRQIFMTADQYYENAMEIYLSWENKAQYLNSLLERVAMHDLAFTTLTGFGSKLKSMQKMIQLLVSSKQVIKFNCDEDEKEEIKNMILILLQQISNSLTNIVKVYSSKLSKYQQEVKKWKKLDMKITSTLLTLKEDRLEEILCEVCDDIQGLS